MSLDQNIVKNIRTVLSKYKDMPGVTEKVVNNEALPYVLDLDTPSGNLRYYVVDFDIDHLPHEFNEFKEMCMNSYRVMYQHGMFVEGYGGKC